MKRSVTDCDRPAKANFREFLFAALLKHLDDDRDGDELAHFREFLFAALLKQLKHDLNFTGRQKFPRISIRGFIEAGKSWTRRSIAALSFPRISIRGFIEAIVPGGPRIKRAVYFREFLFAALLKPLIFASGKAQQKISANFYSRLY